MPIRQIDIFFPPSRQEAVEAAFEGHPTVARWRETMEDGQDHVTALVEASRTEPILDRLELAFRAVEQFCAVVQPVEAVVPRPAAPPPPPTTEVAEGEAPAGPKPPPLRISREELYAKVVDGAELNPTYLAFVVLSTLVAAVGLVRDNVAVIIGAMVIAPLLGPNVALALATTLADRDLFWRAIQVAGAGFGTAFILALGFGVGWPESILSQEILGRTVVTFSDVVLALASGCAGALALTSGLSSALIGVMVAVALLPPFVAFGMLFGAGRLPEAGGALLLLGVNLVCVNLAGVATFLVQGIRPRTWWHAQRARRATWKALAAWVTLLAVLVALIVLSQQR